MDKVFCEGFNFERRENAPDFVVGRLSVKVEKAKEFLDAHKNDRGYVNMNILMSRSGGYYVEKDNWQPKKKEDGSWTPRPQTQAQIDEMKNMDTIDYPEEEINPDVIPF